MLGLRRGLQVHLAFILCLSAQAGAQITDASFFPALKSINPGVVHLRKGGFVAADYGKKAVRRNHEVPLGGIVGGINTDIDLTKTTVFGAVARGFLNAEVLFDQENGLRRETINSTTRGYRVIEDEASSTYFGGMFDLGLIGVSYSQANFQFFNEFRIGTPPDLSARDERTGIDYTNLKLGIAFGISYVRLGAYVLDQKGQGDLAYTYYDPATGNQGSTIDSPITTRAKGYGAGLGFTTTRARAEVTYESLHDNQLTINSDYPKEMTAPGDATRTSVVTELKLWKLMLGARYRIIKGNYRDLEDIISSSLLYQNLGDADERTEMTFNVSLGDSKGLSPSAFYTQSEVTSEELSPVFDNGLKYRAVTKSSAYGVSLSYRF